MHSPEFDFEKDRARVQQVAEAHGKTGAIYVDNDLAYFNAIGADYWPEFYLVDKQGRIRARITGGVREGDPISDATHELIAKLLKE